MDESQNKYDERSQTKKEYTAYDFTYIKFWKMQNNLE